MAIALICHWQTLWQIDGLHSHSHNHSHSYIHKNKNKNKHRVANVLSCVRLWPIGKTCRTRMWL